MIQEVMDICTNACERNVANNEKVNYIINPEGSCMFMLFFPTVHRQ